MTILATLATLLALSGAVTPNANTTATDAKKPPAHQVIAVYFHRTERCPTCKRIGALAEEAVAKGFAKETKARVVEFRFVDFQDKKNAKLAKSYSIDGPTLVLLSVFDGQVECWTALPKVWQLVGKPDEFRAYVRDGVTKSLAQSKADAQKQHKQAQESQP